MVKRHPRRELRCDLRPLPKMQLNPLQRLKQMRQEQYVFEHVRKKKNLISFSASMHIFSLFKVTSVYHIGNF